MPVFDFGSGHLEIAVGFAGAAMAGRSATLEYLRGHVRAASKSDIKAAESRGGRSIGFDLGIGRSVPGFSDFDLTVRLMTVPEGAAGALLLDRLDGIVFVVDSTWGRIEAGLGALESLRRGFSERGIEPGEIPMVLQYNKRGLAEVAPSGYLDFVFSRDPAVKARYETDALSGANIVPTLDGILKLILAKGPQPRR
jgi:hypothetical protein